MKKIIFTFIFAIPSLLFAQISEDFSDNSFLERENILGTKEKFVINAAEQLQLFDASAAGTSNNVYISMPSEAIDNAVWQLSVKISATTSSSNYVRYYLAADSSNLSGSLNGYYVMIGNTDDEISLYRQNGTTRTKIIDGMDKKIDVPVVEVQVKVTRDADGNWELFSKIPSDEDFVSEGVCSDFGIFKSVFSGIFVQYSSGNKDKYFFDDWQVSGEKYVKPVLRADDIVFSELMVKPAPAVSFLPENEYIEIYNRTDNRINLSGFHLADNSRKYLIDNCVIQPHSYLLLCAENKIADFIGISNVKGISSLPTLTDGGKLLWLEDDEGNLITWIEYADTWYGSAFKSGGGWSLECIDLNNVSGNADNWIASTSENGGTPAQENAVARKNPDEIAPKIEKLAISSDKSIDIFFNEQMGDLSKISNFAIENLTISRIETQKPQNKSMTIYFEEEITLRNIYEITLKNLTDKSGNPLESKTIKFAIPETTEPNDVIINELLFHPASGGEKYVELYNRSDKTIDLSALMLSNRKNGELQAGTPISSARMLLFAGEYVLLSANTDVVCEQYTCGENTLKINLKSFPSYPIAGGEVVLVARNGTIIDEFAYSEKLHHPMVKNPVGVSLERINPDLPHANNWHSASFECGYGTPGAKNSQFIDENTVSDKTVRLAPETFSPNNDGNNDFLNIYYHLGENGYTATVKIYDANGRCVRKLVNNVLAESEGVFRWNGENDNGNICNIGIYVAYIEFTKTNGSVKHYKLPCVLSVE